MEFQNDKSFAKALCNKSKKAFRTFQDLYCDELYFVSSKFCNRGTSQESWQYRSEKGYTVKVDDNVADTYVWLVKNIISNKSCNFKGDKGASFESYIKTILNSEFTFKDWLKWKTNDSIIKVPGYTGYIPKCIKDLDDLSIEIFKLLRQKKSDQTICNKLGLKYIDFLNLYNILEDKLLESNQIHLISFPRVSSMDNEMEDGEIKEVQLPGTLEISPEKFPDFQILQTIIEDLLNELPLSERKILILWASGYSAEDILTEIEVKPFYKKIWCTRN